MIPDAGLAVGHGVDDTIVAVSSPPGRSSRGLIRVAGPQCRHILRALTKAKPPAPRMLTRVRLRQPSLPALLIQFAKPHSYTGQDSAELQVPGNAALLERLLHVAIEAGARLAQPGEFTFRAFLAGKIDLTQAEGVAATIAATSDSQLEAATLLRQGKLGSFAADLVSRIADLLALVEAAIDFTDQEDVVPIASARLDDKLAKIEAQLSHRLAHSRAWGELQALPHVVLVGPPSVGKSTLFNALLGRRRTATSAMAGTTRDVIAEPMQLTLLDGRSVEIMLVDMAGLGQARAQLDRQVQDAAQKAMRQADLIVQLTDGDDSAKGVPGAHIPGVLVRTKVDLASAAGAGLKDCIPVSGKTGHNIELLRSVIARQIGQRGVSKSAGMLALQPRHAAALRNGLEAVGHARQLLAPQENAQQIAHVELVAGHLRTALDELAGLGGQMTPDDVIGRVFATFCVGK